MLAIACALAALAAAALAPAFAAAQAADNEYNLTLPGADGGGKGDAGTGQAPGAQASGGESGGGGGAPIVLIGLAAVAAVCAGLAVWRLRDRSGPPSAKVGTGAPEAASETQ